MVGGAEGRITSEAEKLAVWVIPTDVELLIARDTFRVVTGVEGRY
jgi:acetate kinase